MTAEATPGAEAPSSGLPRSRMGSGVTCGQSCLLSLPRQAGPLSVLQKGKLRHTHFSTPCPVPGQGTRGSRVRSWSRFPMTGDVGYAAHGQVAGGPQRTTHRLVTVPSLGGCIPWFLHSHRSASVPEPRRGWRVPRDTSGQSIPHLRSRGHWCCTPVSHVHFAATIVGGSGSHPPPFRSEPHTSDWTPGTPYRGPGGQMQAAED